MTETLQDSRQQHIFPVLSPAQLERMRRHGRARQVRAGEVLVEPGSKESPVFVVVRGRIEILRPSGAAEELVIGLQAGQFTGEASTLSGRRGFVRLRASEDGEVIEVSREQLLALVQSDGELSGILMRAFILRRVELIARGLGDVVLLGSNHCSATLRVREFLNRNGHPYTFIDLDEGNDVQELLDRFQVSEGDVPVLICGGTRLLRNPSNREIADCLGLNEGVDATKVRDVVIVGAGPSGLAAAVYAASEGLDVLVLESNAPGGQAGASSRIENYLGFPTGISGQELAARAFTQAQKFGAEILVARGAVKLSCARKPFSIELGGGPPVPARAVIIATGAEYRRLALDNLAQYEGAGVHYAATYMEAQLCRGEDAIVVGGGNSAGQAAVFLAEKGSRVQIFVRGDGLAETMSRYLIRRIEDNPAVVVRIRSEITALEGEGSLERVHWRDNATGKTGRQDIRHVFVMAGAVPNTHWLEGCLALDASGFIKTGPDLGAEDLQGEAWQHRREPWLFETSRPGVFAVGDVRCRSLKRVASAVGEGAIAVALVHQALREM